MEGFKQILGSAINFLQNRLRQKNRTPDEDRDAVNNPTKWRDLARNVLGTFGDRLERVSGGDSNGYGSVKSEGGDSDDGESEGGADAGEGSEDAEMERFGLGKLAGKLFKLLSSNRSG